MCRTSKLLVPTRWLPLGLIVLAAIAGTSQVAYAQAGVGVALNLNGGANLHVGTSPLTGSFTIQNTSAPNSVSESITNAFLVLVPSCKNQLAGTPCGSNDAGVITVLSAPAPTSTSGCKDAGGVNTATWSVTNNGDGSFNLTPSLTIVLPANGALCTVQFSFTVNTLPTADSRPTTPTIIDTDNAVGPVVVDGSDGSSAAATGTSHNAFDFTCAVKVDKQISCDGGATWNDVGEQSANGDGNNGCIGKVGDNDIKVRYFSQNISDSGITLNTCNITESNNSLGPGVSTNFSIGNNGSNGGASTQETGELGLTPSALVCETARSNKEPDTGSVDCTCNIPALGPNAPHATATDGATFECCGVKVDKQVSCNGNPFVDVGLVSANEGGTGSCNALTGQPVAVQYFVQNTGTVQLTCNASDIPAQGLFDTFVVNNNVALALQTVGPISSGSTTGPIANPNITTCNDTLNSNEALGNKAQVDCTCAGSAALGGSVAVSAFDIAQITCSTPAFNISKACVATTPGGSTFNSTVTVNNTGNVNLSCAIVDQYIPGACTGGLPTCPISGGTPVTEVPNPLLVSAATSGNSVGQFTTASTVCNQACVTCTPEGGAALPAVSAVDTCPVNTGCFTRTPGYWGTHPAQTQQVIGAGLPVCGITLTTTTAGVNNSATEDLCESGRDFKAANTSPQQLQLIRQCTSAALNLRVSAQANLGCESSSPGIEAAFATCCGDNGICDSGKTPNQINTSLCISVLDAFNNQFDSTDFPAFLTNASANPNQCQIANGNGFVNPGRNLGPAK
jgi:hypothetical protein